MSNPHGLSPLVRRRQFGQDSINDHTFGRLFDRNPVTAPQPPQQAVPLLNALADGMREEGPSEGPADAGMTFLGQFIDHDVTLDVTSMIAKPETSSSVINQRTPALDLDCVFGGGSEARPLLYSQKHSHYLYHGTSTNSLDLARNHEGVAKIGDPRNDENAFVAAVQSLFIRFYNLLLHAIEHDTDGAAALKHTGESATEAAVRLSRWHYQHIILTEFLPAFVNETVLEKALHILRHGSLPRGFRHGVGFIPAEFSVAAYRFGHGTVQSTYDIGSRVVNLFANDGQPGLPAFGPKSEVIDMSKFFTVPGGSPAQKARPVGPTLAAELFDLPMFSGANAADIEGLIGEEPIRIPSDQAMSLAHRNLYRDRFTFELASGQTAAGSMGFTAIDRDENTRRAGLDKIPLFYYCLQEGTHNGGKLGEVGGTIVTTVLARLLRDDTSSVWHAPGWSSHLAVGGSFTMGTMVKYVEDNWAGFAIKDELTVPG